MNDLSRRHGLLKAEYLLRETSGWLSAEVDRGRSHTELSKHLGVLARFAQQQDIVRQAERHLREANPSELRGVRITNVDASKFRARPTLPAENEGVEMYPVYSSSALVESMREQGVEHINLVLQQRDDDAWRSAADDLSKEECVSTRAVLGDPKAAYERMRRSDFPQSRRFGASIVIAVESLRADEVALSEAVLEEVRTDERVAGWGWIWLAAGFLVRVPWGGYPYPDY